MATDMSLGGASFGAGYTPIQFAPLVSLTGPVMAPATPAAPEAVAPLIRPPVMADQSGSYEIPTRTDAAFQSLQPIGTRIEQNGIGPELRDLGRGLSFMTSPLISTGSLLATGKLPLDHVLGDMGGAAQPGAPAQGTAAAPFSGFLQSLRDFLFGPQQPSVQLPYESGKYLSIENDGSMIGAVINDTKSVAESWGLSPDQTQNAVAAAANMFAQGTDAATAVTMALMNASMAATQMDMAGSPFGQPATQGAAPQGTVVAAPAQTFALGQPSESSYSPGGYSADFSDFGEASGATGGWV